jgi:hypothetical protein
MIQLYYFCIYAQKNQSQLPSCTSQSRLQNQSRCLSAEVRDKENIVYIHNGALFSYKEEGTFVLFRKISKAGDHHVKCNKPVSQWYVCFHSYLDYRGKTKNMKVKRELLDIGKGKR